MRRYVILVALAAAVTGSAGPAAQAQLSSAQQSALKSNCRSDFMSHCSGVTPGGKDALVCLQKNVDRLSGGCQAAVRATLPAPAPAAAAKPEPAPQPVTAAPPSPAPAHTPAAPPPPQHRVKLAAPPPAAVKPAAVTMTPTAEQQSAMRASCRNDFMAKCAGVQPGGRDALACLQRHVATLSGSCKTVVAATMSGTPAATPAVATAPAAAAPAAAIDPAKLKALKFTCRGDFRRLCKNAPEGPQALACLEAHSARLSPHCRTSVADLAASIPEGAAMPAPTPVAVKPAPVPHNPKAPVIDAAVVLRACKLDLLRHCRGAGVGGGKVMACLTAHEADLTFRCRTAMKVSSPLH